MDKKGIAIYMRFLLALLTTSLLFSCYSPEEGCLDPESTNYSITGDNDCLDCCTYPVLQISIYHENRETTFNLNDTVTNELRQQISLLDFAILLSDFKIEFDGNSAEVEDSLSLNVDDGVLFVKDDVIRASRSDFTYEIGTIIFEGNANQISFKIGVNDLLNENRFTNEIEDHPLTTDPDSLFQEDTGTYVFQRIKIAQGNKFIDTITYDVTTTYDVSFPIDFESIRGEDKTIEIEAQYEKWFEGIDFSISSPSEIQKKISENSKNVFRQKE
jgi:hypothetical protein